MNDTILILLAIVVGANILLIAFLVIPSVLRQRRQHQFVDSLPAVGSTDSPRERVYTPATPLVDDSPAPARTDTLTGLLLPGEWNRILADEDARVRRYGRPATIVLIEIDGLDRLVRALGQGAGNRLIPAVADTLSRHARGADQLARLESGRFGVLLPETNEVEAVNYVERVRSACDLWLEAAAVSLKLAIGWAAPPAEGGLADAIAIAEERLVAEQGRTAHPATEVPAPAPKASTILAGWPSTA